MATAEKAAAAIRRFIVVPALRRRARRCAESAASFEGNGWCEFGDFPFPSSPNFGGNSEKTRRRQSPCARDRAVTLPRRARARGREKHQSENDAAKGPFGDVELGVRFDGMLGYASISISNAAPSCVSAQRTVSKLD